MNADAAEVLAQARSRTATLAEAHVLLDAIMSQAPDDNTHSRLHSHHAILVHHEGEKQPRAAVMPIEYYRMLTGALAAPPPADTKKPPRRKKRKESG